MPGPTTLPFPDNHFDLAISTDIFDPPEVRRVLKPGGAFILSTYWDDARATFRSLASDWGLELQSGMDVTPLAFAFHRAKEEEARLLVQAGMLPARELVQIVNENITPYAARGGRHLLMRLTKPISRRTNARSTPGMGPFDTDQAACP